MFHLGLSLSPTLKYLHNPTNTYYKIKSVFSWQLVSASSQFFLIIVGDCSPLFSLLSGFPHIHSFCHCLVATLTTTPNHCITCHHTCHPTKPTYLCHSITHSTITVHTYSNASLQCIQINSNVP